MTNSKKQFLGAESRAEELAYRVVLTVALPLGSGIIAFVEAIRIGSGSEAYVLLALAMLLIFAGTNRAIATADDELNP